MKYVVKRNDNFDKLGSKKAGYAGAKYGPFACGHCLHFRGKGKGLGYCNHPEVISDPEMEKEDNKAVVEAKGCCTYYRNQ